MTKEELAVIWKKACESVRDRFNPKAYQAIFRSSVLEEVNRTTAELSVDNTTSRGFILKFASEQICRELSTQLGTPITTLNVVIKKAKETKDGKEGSLGDSHQEPVVPVVPTELFNVKTGDYEPNPTLVSNLNPKYTFATFITGNRNRLAYAAAQSVAEKPGSINPLYLYGGVGLGKTHLMQAVGNEILAKDPTKRVLYVSCETFMNEFVSGIRKGDKDSFKKKYRNVDVFLVDDIQFIAGKDGTQEEFFHTFNALHQTNGQIIITSDKKPSDIKGLEERLSSRFSAGLLADIQPPDYETRQAILLSKCHERGISLPREAISFIAEMVETNIRELEGALTRVSLSLQAGGITNPSMHDIQKALDGVISVSQNKPTKKGITQSLREIICEYYGITGDELIGPRRQQELVKPRQIFMYLLKHEVGMTFPMIGREVGGRDHTTAMHAVDKIEKEIKKSPELLEELQHLKQQLYSLQKT